MVWFWHTLSENEKKIISEYFVSCVIICWTVFYYSDTVRKNMDSLLVQENAMVQNQYFWDSPCYRKMDFSQCTPEQKSELLWNLHSCRYSELSITCAWASWYDWTCPEQEVGHLLQPGTFVPIRTQQIVMRAGRPGCSCHYRASQWKSPYFPLLSYPCLKAS